MHCKDCKWWDRTYEDEPAGYDCFMNERRECHCERNASGIGSDGCAGSPNRGWGEGKIWTGPEFGCIHWETTDG